MDTTSKSNATANAKTPEQVARNISQEKVDDMTRKISNKGVFHGVVVEQQQSQPVRTEEHDDIGRSVFTREEIEEEIERMSDSGAFSDDADQTENDAIDDTNGKKHKKRDRNDSEDGSSDSCSTITNASSKGSPPKKKQKKENPNLVPMRKGGVSSEEDDSEDDSSEIEDEIEDEGEAKVVVEAGNGMEIEDEKKDDVNPLDESSCLMQLLGPNAIVAGVMQHVVGKKYAVNDDPDRVIVKPEAMQDLALRVLFNDVDNRDDDDVSEDELKMIHDIKQELKKLPEDKAKKFKPFDEAKVDLLKKLDIEPNTAWHTAVSDLEELLEQCEKLGVKDGKPEEYYERTFLKVSKAVKAWSKALAKKKDEQKKCLKNFMHERPKPNDTANEKLKVSMMHDHILKRAGAYEMVDDTKYGVDGPYFFAMSFFRAITMLDTKVEFPVPVKLIEKAALDKNVPGITELRQYVTREHMKSPNGAMMEIVIGCRTHGGSLIAVDKFSDAHPYEMAKFIENLSRDSQLHGLEHFENLSSYQTDGKNHLMFMEDFIGVDACGNIIISDIPKVKGKNNPTLAVGDVFFKEGVEERLRELHSLTSFATSRRQAKLANATRKLAMAILTREVKLTDKARKTESGHEQLGVLQHFQNWAQQLNRCAKDGLDRRQITSNCVAVQ